MNKNYAKILDFYSRYACAHPESPATLGVSNDIEREYRETQEWEHFQRIVPLDKTMNVLELGCGAGRWCFNMSPFVNSVFGIDCSKQMILLAEEKKTKMRANNVLLEASDLSTFKSNGHYDLIYFSGVLLYIEDADLSGVFHMYANLLSDRGIVVVRDTCMTKKRLFREYPHGVQYGPCPSIYRTPEEYIGLFKECGCELSYRAPSYIHIRPHFIGRSKFIAGIFRQKKRLLFRLLKTLSLIIGCVIPPVKMSKNDFSHEFQVYKRLKQRSL